MQQRPSLARRMRMLRVAEQSKRNRFVWSGLVITLAGLLLITYGVFLHTGAYSPEGIAIVFGALIVLAGIIRILIGVINPATPDDLRPYEEQEKHEGEENIDDQLFSSGSP